MKINQLYGFKRIPTSETEENTEVERKKHKKNSSLKRRRYEETDNFTNISYFTIFIFILALFIIFWALQQLYWILIYYDIIKIKPKLSIIINVYDKKSNLTKLLKSIMDQSITYYEIIITKNFFHIDYNQTDFEQFKRKDVKIRIIQYGENDSNVKIRIDSGSIAKGEYILFINPNEYFSKNNLNLLFQKAIKNEIDITQYDSFYDDIEFNTIVTQPKLFDSMFFDHDIIRQTHFHLTGKFIKKECFLEAVKDIDNFYLENNNIYYEENMILFKLFKKANTFLKLKIKPYGNKKCNIKHCSFQLIVKESYTKDQIKDALIYLKFLYQYTDYNVIEKRMSIKLFINILVSKPIVKNKYDHILIKLLDEVIELYLNCDLINEYDINLLKQYRRNIIIKNN